MDIQFGRYRLKRAERQLLGPDGPVGLAARSFDILGALLDRPDAVVGKTELFNTIWPDMVVGENALQVHVSALRKALPPGMIVTVHGRGYKYGGPRPVEVDPDHPDGPAPQKGPTAGVTPAGHKPTIAVLPFTDISGDPDQKHISDGITEDITTELARFSNVSVAARHASFQLGGKGALLAARELGVNFVVEGSVRKSGERIRITVQLIEASTGNHVWAERFDRETHDIFAVQDEVVFSDSGDARGAHGERRRGAAPQEADLKLDRLRLLAARSGNRLAGQRAGS